MSLQVKELFAFSTAASGDLYFAGLPVEVDSFLAAHGVDSWQELLSHGARRRHMRELMFVDACWDVHMCLRICWDSFVTRLAEYRVLACAAHDPARCHIVDLSQNAQYTRKTHERMFCLLRNSQPFLLGKDLSCLLLHVVAVHI